MGRKKNKILTEVKADDIVSDSKQSDPTRIKRSKNVKSTYIGMSKFGILNFKTTSETRNGYHYQTIEFKDLQPFWDIIEDGKEIVGADIKDQLEKQDINVYCSDESFTWWAWYHKAYKNDYAYIDDKIPDLNNRLKAPQVNNVSLRGGSCKHILSVLDYIKKPYVLMQIAQDMTDYLNGNVSARDKQDIETTFQADAVKGWDKEDVENYLGMSRDEVISELRKIIKTDDKIDSVYDAITLGLLDDKRLSKLDKEKVAVKIETELDLDKELQNLLGDEEAISNKIINSMGESAKPNIKLKEAQWSKISGGKGIYTIDHYYNQINSVVLPIIRDLGFRITEYPYKEEPGEATYRAMQEDSKDILYFEFSSQNTKRDEGSKDVIELRVSYNGNESEEVSLDLKDKKQIKNAITMSLDNIGYDPFSEEKEESEEERKRIQFELDKKQKWKAEDEERDERLNSLSNEEPEEEIVVNKKVEFPDLNKPMKLKSKGKLSSVVNIEDIKTLDDFKKAFIKDLGDVVGNKNPLIATDEKTGNFIAVVGDNAYELDKETGKWKKSPVKF